jgi:catechol 2,3-dioxygenase-like lactoylglutathione lyase family enzyme
MTAIRYLLWLMLIGSALAHAAAEPPALLRTTLIVADVDRALSFYGRLGFSVESDRGGPRKPDSPFPLASASTTFRLVILATPDPASGKIGLLAFAAPPPPVTVAARPRVGIGDLVFVVRAADAATAYAALQAAGDKLVEPAPIPYEMKRPDGSPGRGSLFHVYDPDGRLVEVMAPAAMDSPPRRQ